MLDTLKNAALAALIVFALVYALGVTTHTVHTTAAAPATTYHKKTYPSTASERFAGAAEGRTVPCSYDGDFTNDPPGCK